MQAKNYSQIETLSEVIRDYITEHENDIAKRGFNPNALRAQENSMVTTMLLHFEKILLLYVAKEKRKK